MNQYRVTRQHQYDINKMTGSEVPVPGGRGWKLVDTCASDQCVFWTWVHHWDEPVEPTEIPPSGRRTQPMRGKDDL